MRNRTRVSLPLAVTLGLVASLTLAGVVQAAETILTATLAGSSDTDPDGTGTAKVTLDPATGSACWELSGTGIPAVTQSHIHTGAVGVSGGVVVPLDVDGFTGTSQGCVTGQAAATLQAIIDGPSGYYVNLHTADFPAGAIRGQLAASAAPNTALPVEEGTPALLGTLLLAVGLAIGLRIWRAVGARD